MSPLAVAVTVAPTARPRQGPLKVPLLQRRYQDLTRKHLSGMMDRLFAEFTGLHYHIAWARPLPNHWGDMTFPTGYGECRRLAGAGDGGERYCRICGPRHLACTLRADGQGHYFNCRLGVRNYWFAIRVRGVAVGVAYIQASANDLSERPQPRHSARAGAPLVSRPDFHRAGRLLRLMVRYAQTMDLAELRRADLTSARRAVAALRNEKARLGEELKRIIPTIPKTPSVVQAEKHTEQVVQGVLAMVHQGYSQALTLKECARNLGLNAAYLSALFSRTVGVSFKRYLTELRLQMAKQLLNDPVKSISAVAQATGYSSENRFRLAFKKATGLSPRTWRETFHAAWQIPLSWLVGEQEIIEGLEALISC